MISSVLLATLFSFLFALTQAKKPSIYSFAEGKSSPDGLRHGARGFECMKALHGTDMAFLKDIDNNGEEVTDEHIAAAIFMAYGEIGINHLCDFNRHLGDDSTRRWLRSAGQAATEPIANVYTERRTETCDGGSAAGYPADSKADPNGVYSKYITTTLAKYLPDGASANTRMDPPKVVTEAQKPLDEALEGEYHSILCDTYFSAFANLASVPDFVVFKQGPILDGINELSCRIAQRAMRTVQGKIRYVMSEGMKHNALINQAEMSATYANTRILAGAMCTLSKEISDITTEVQAIKERVASTPP